MDTYNVTISPKALSQLKSYVDYIQFTLLNPTAAKAVWEDALDTAARLETVAGSLKDAAHPLLRRNGYKAILFKSHRYIMLYRIENQTAIVEAIYHQLQDYEGIFASEIE